MCNNIKPKEPNLNGNSGCFGGIIGGIISIIFLFCDTVNNKIFRFFYYDLGVSDLMWKLIAIILIIFPMITMSIIFKSVYKIMFKEENEKKINMYKIQLRNYAEKEKNEEIKNQKYISENEIPHDAMEVNCVNPFNDVILKIWINNNNLCFAGINYMDNIKRFEIPKKNINSFFRQGDVYNEVKISEGNMEGGGSSISGAIIGGVIAGGAGAIIGSRKKIKSKEINSENIRIDKRQTILEYMENEEYKYLFFNSYAYDILIKLIPEKEFQLVKQRGENTNNFNHTNNDVYKNIRELSKLKDEGILSNEEFLEKKKELLNTL
ncbi:SHOCT domain-containing protein [Clostridium botulinum]|uniref:SHOCT domain-containing protein n=1 Tax=Clostridium botulinum TaxID=1491 RepID=A0A6G4D9I0_CLOBO|nr:SHOCT domain-containing protein [Clostridium botulinum]NFU59497.1 SHOCT domain-containing protein [Clostridium botulinum]NFV47489.1 SHOCT domain-containing protein [Clostridium botulinum]